MPELAVILVSHNARVDLDRCLASLSAAPPATSHEVLVVDNASTDGSQSLVTERFPHVRLIALDRNVGFGPANNAGIRATHSRLVLLLNSDTVVPPGAIDRLVADLEAHPDVAVVGPRLVDAGGRPEISFGRMIGPFNELRQKILGALYDYADAIAPEI
jgi:GT2 family glycosyltransferase